MSLDTSGPWAQVIFVQDWEIERQHCEECAEFEYDAEVPEWGDWEAMATYLTQWDDGDETDGADTREWSAGGLDDVHEFTIDGLDYVLTTNSHLRYAGLVRRPLRNAWGTLRTDVCEGYCDECEREGDRHYDNCYKHKPSF